MALQHLQFICTYQHHDHKDYEALLICLNHQFCEFSCFSSINLFFSFSFFLFTNQPSVTINNLPRLYFITRPSPIVVLKLSCFFYHLLTMTWKRKQRKEKKNDTTCRFLTHRRAFLFFFLIKLCRFSIILSIKNEKVKNNISCRS